jgi:hypothetical protein
MLDKFKDILSVESLLRSWVNRVLRKHDLEKLGKVTRVDLDRDQRKIFLDLDLQGEESLVSLELSYRAINATEIEIEHIETSREWMTVIMNDMIPKSRKQFTVPKPAMALLS